MLFFLVHLAMRRLVRVFAGSSAVAALEVENAVLRHQLRVLRRTVRRPPLRTRDRLLLAAASGLLPRDRLGGVSGVAADAFALAPRAGAEEVELPAPRGRSAAA